MAGVSLYCDVGWSCSLSTKGITMLGLRLFPYDSCSTAVLLFVRFNYLSLPSFLEGLYE